MSGGVSPGPYGGPTRESREAYHRYVADAAASRGFALTVWDAGEKSNKAIYLASTRSWVEGVRDAVLGINGTATSGADVPCPISWYPNPADEVLYFHSSLPLDSIECFDVRGQKWFSIAKPSRNRIETNQLPAGMYYIVARFENGMAACGKFVIAVR